MLAGRELKPGFEPIQHHNSPVRLTDGANIFGKIIATRDWIEQLALRHDLETERPHGAAQSGSALQLSRSSSSPCSGTFPY